MKRTLRTSLALLLALTVLGLVRAQDFVTYADKVTKKDGKVQWKILDEGPAGIKIEVKEGKETVQKLIAPGDIRKVIYSVKEVAKLDFERPFGKEERAQDPKNAKEKEKMLADARRCTASTATRSPARRPGATWSTRLPRSR